MCVCVCSFQIGQIALFMCDQYGNYLALGADSKTYYLDSDCAHNLQDLVARMATLRFKGYVLMGLCLCAQPQMFVCLCVHFLGGFWLVESLGDCTWKLGRWVWLCG